MIPNLYVENGWKSPNIHENKWLFGVPGYDILHDSISTLVDPDFIRLRWSFAKFEGFPSRKPKKKHPANRWRWCQLRKIVWWVLRSSLSRPSLESVGGNWGHGSLVSLFPKQKKRSYCWWFRYPVNSPVEVGSLAPVIYNFLHPRWCRISSINSMNMYLLLIAQTSTGNINNKKRWFTLLVN